MIFKILIALALYDLIKIVVASIVKVIMKRYFPKYHKNVLEELKEEKIKKWQSVT